MAQTVGYIASTIPAKIDRVSGTTLFHLAVIEFGDPLRWVDIAMLNGIVDPWVTPLSEILIPPTLLPGTPTGLLSPTWSPPSPADPPPPSLVTTIPPTIPVIPPVNPYIAFLAATSSLTVGTATQTMQALALLANASGLNALVSQTMQAAAPLAGAGSLTVGLVPPGVFSLREDSSIALREDSTSELEDHA